MPFNLLKIIMALLQHGKNKFYNQISEHNDNKNKDFTSVSLTKFMVTTTVGAQVDYRTSQVIITLSNRE